jgi:hypothetical protein
MWDAKKIFLKILLKDYIKYKLHKRYFLKERRAPFISKGVFLYLKNFLCGMLRKHSEKFYLDTIEGLHKCKPHKSFF